MNQTPSLTVRTNFTPPFTFNPFSKSELKEGGLSITKILQPSIDGVLPIVGEVHYAPNGQPTGYGEMVLALIVGLAVYGAFRLIKG